MTALGQSKQILGLLAWLAISFITAAIGAAGSVQSQSIYSQLQQPSWAPQAWVFGPVWSILFTLMGIAAWWVWRRGGFHSHTKALALFLLQLVFNGLWSWLFFAWMLGALALANIIMLWCLIVATVIAFRQISVLAAALMVPYLLWVSFAAILNYALWQLNPNLLG